MSSLDALASPAVVNAVALYSARSGPSVRAILRRGYSEDATFDDGAVSVRGHPGTVAPFLFVPFFFVSFAMTQQKPPQKKKFFFSLPFLTLSFEDTKEKNRKNRRCARA